MFKTAFKYVPLSDKEWMLTDDLIYIHETKSSAEVHIVPDGFVTDFASIPRVFRGVFPKHGLYSPAAVVHDWLYHIRKGSRSRADSTFLAAMLDLKVPLVQASLIYAAVRLGGWIVWRSR
jgi:hypothetical protein